MPREDMQRNFASDNYAGLVPECLDALTQANRGHAPSYGADEWTRDACAAIREVFETDCEVFFAFNGTAANSMALAHLCRSYHSVICHETAHVETDECGAPEFFSAGSKILLAKGGGGRIDPSEVTRLVHLREDIHYPKPHVLSLTQATEHGTVYQPGELTELCALAHGLDLKVHMDGARFANAVAALQCAPKEISWQAGVDVLVFGGSKNGMLASEAVVFFDRQLAAEFDYRCKQAGQLASKMRFLAAPWTTLLRSGGWLRYAAQANRMAALLAARLKDLPGVALLNETQANAVFVSFPQSTIDALRAQGWRFYQFIGDGGIRLMCSWDTTENDVEAFVANVIASLPPSS